MPEDNNLSSGYSLAKMRVFGIDNYKNISSYLTNREYAFWDEIQVIQEDSEYPQGLCFTEDFVCISYYSEVNGELGKIKLFDKESGEYLLSLGIDSESHLGGIAYDGSYIWTCNSSKMAIEKISYEFVREMASRYQGETLDVRNMVDVYSVKNIPSSITYFDGKLCVVSHSKKNDGRMIGYNYNAKKDTLKAKEKITIPSKVQGVSFSDDGEIYLSMSYGRRSSSYIKKYDSINSLKDGLDTFIENIKLPPCAEGIVCEMDKLYVLFESAGKKYLEGTDGYGQSTDPLDRILIIKMK